MTQDEIVECLAIGSKSLLDQMKKSVEDAKTAFSGLSNYIEELKEKNRKAEEKISKMKLFIKNQGFAINEEWWP